MAVLGLYNKDVGALEVMILQEFPSNALVCALSLLNLKGSVMI
jgi:hypothetical protein